MDADLADVAAMQVDVTSAGSTICAATSASARSVGEPMSAPDSPRSAPRSIGYMHGHLLERRDVEGGAMMTDLLEARRINARNQARERDGRRAFRAVAAGDEGDRFARSGAMDHATELLSPRRRWRALQFAAPCGRAPPRRC
jgi:hypothetical protein